MAYRSFSLIPTLNNSLLTDRFTQMDNLFSRLTGEKPLSDTPAYNLLKNGEQHELTVSVPGYVQDELDVSVLNNQLSVQGKLNVVKTDGEEEKEGIKWLHQGIKKSEFSLSFTLEHRIVIKQANLANGLLTLHFTYDIPEQEKPQQVAIRVQNSAGRVLEHCAA
ncbi:MAG: Hsp20 family protein [Sodalis sp. (in: enterobacteria)]